MSYCVNCGVELAPSEKRCPLCGVEVVNPAKPWTEPEALPYSDNAERIRRIDRRYLAGLISLVLLIPAVVCMFCDILDGRLSWSLLVTGALLNVFVIFLVPMMLHRPSALLLIALDTVSTSAYLLLIRIACGLPASGKDWLLPLALPIVLLTAILAAAFSTLAAQTASHCADMRLCLFGHRDSDGRDKPFCEPVLRACAYAGMVAVFHAALSCAVCVFSGA